MNCVPLLCITWKKSIHTQNLREVILETFIYSTAWNPSFGKEKFVKGQSHLSLRLNTNKSKWRETLKNNRLTYYFKCDKTLKIIHGRIRGAVHSFSFNHVAQIQVDMLLSAEA